MSFEFDTPEKMDSDSTFLTEPGTYHFAVLAVDERPTNKAGAPLDGFRVHCCALDGTATGQAKKEIELLFFAPKPTEKNGGEFSKRKIARFAMATGILPQAAPGQRVSIDLQAAAGRQFVAEVERQKDQQGNETKFLQLAWANIWHVDDPAVASVPKDATALGLLPKDLRRAAESFATAKPNGNGQQAQQKPAATGGVDLSDL